MASFIKNVAVVGVRMLLFLLLSRTEQSTESCALHLIPQAGGNSGAYMTRALVETGKHNVTALTRADSKSKLPEGVKTVVIDYSDESSLVKALQGQVALVITMGVMAPPEQQSKLIRAAGEAGVPWILPNEYSPDTYNESLVSAVPSFQGPPKYRDEIVKLGKSSFVAVTTGFWYEWSIAYPDGYGFDINKRTAVIYDDGRQKINTSTWPQVGRTVASLLSLPVAQKNEQGVSLDDFRNKQVRASSFLVSQQDMLESLLRVTKTTRQDWSITSEPSEKRYSDAMQAAQKGDYSAYARVLYTRTFYPNGDGDFETSKGLHNKELNLPVEELDEATMAGVERAKSTPAW